MCKDGERYLADETANVRAHGGEDEEGNHCGCSGYSRG